MYSVLNPFPLASISLGSDACACARVRVWDALIHLFIESERARERVVNGGKEIFNTNECVYIWKSNECIFCYHDKNDEFFRISLFADAHLHTHTHALRMALANQTTS